LFCFSFIPETKVQSKKDKNKLKYQQEAGRYCGQCDQWYRYGGHQLTKHRKTHGPQNPCSVSGCKASFKNIEDLMAHKKSVHIIKEGKWVTCPGFKLVRTNDDPIQCKKKMYNFIYLDRGLNYY
jgi:hypothetical protein